MYLNGIGCGMQMLDLIGGVYLLFDYLFGTLVRVIDDFCHGNGVLASSQRHG